MHALLLLAWLLPIAAAAAGPGYVTIPAGAFSTLLAYEDNRGPQRVAAFAMAHAVLSVIVFELGGMVAASPGGGVLRVLIMVSVSTCGGPASATQRLQFTGSEISGVILAVSPDCSMTSMLTRANVTLLSISSSAT